MDLKKRLARLDPLQRRAGPAETSAAAADDPASAGGPLSAAAEAAVRRELGLGAHAAAEGEIWRREEPPLDTVGVPRDWPDFAPLFKHAAPARPAPGHLLFLDTETTGLAGGTGSLVFLVGVAWWSAAGLHVRQDFLPGPGRERPLLAALGELAQGFTTVVTFNGNVFDLPLLRTRYLMNRLRDPLQGHLRWDLLPVARRLWGRRLADCRQQTVEAEVCGVTRADDDIEGWRIPQVYFRYVRGGECELLANVLAHNRRDLEGMARIFHAVTARAAQLLRPRAGGAGGDALPWQDAWSNGRLCESHGERRAAARWLERALEMAPFAGRPGAFAAAKQAEVFLQDAVRILKRIQAWDRVESVILTALAHLGGRPWLYREAAILYEHRLGRLPEARRFAGLLGDAHRIARLGRKLSRPG